ncbi:hypothetical protein ACFPM0_11765 [Pseudonocardia sulfidoxydans]|uniref:hypothetical protein n=1 Tax=Pseudonocardia sulfidoxydans TaxID=54011 RepID=UPI00361F5B6A
MTAIGCERASRSRTDVGLAPPTRSVLEPGDPWCPRPVRPASAASGLLGAGSPSAVWGVRADPLSTYAVRRSLSWEAGLPRAAADGAPGVGGSRRRGPTR